MQEPLHSLYKQGVEQLAQGNHGEAAQHFLKIIKEGKDSAHLQYYLGRTYLEAGNASSGVQHLMKSVSIDRFDFQVRQDLSHAQSLVSSSMGTPLKHPYEIAQSIASYVRPQEFFFCSAFLVFIFFVFKYIHYSSKPIKTVVLSLAVITLSLGAFSSFHKKVVTNIKSISVKEAPLENSQERKKIPMSSRLIVLNKGANFSEIQRDGLQGWVENKFITPVISD